MTIATYDELVTELGDWLNRDDLNSKLPTFIRIFESRMNRRLRDPKMETRYTFSTVAGTSSYSLPSDFRQAREVYIDDDQLYVLEPMSPANLRTFFADGTSGRPQAYALVGQSIVLADTPDAAYELVIGYFREVPALTSSNTTNWLLTAHPDLYLWGSLTAAEAYLKDDDRVLLWKAAWDEALAEVMQESNSSRFAGPLTLRPTVIE